MLMKANKARKSRKRAAKSTRPRSASAPKRKAKPPARPKKLKIPPTLLEGEGAARTPASGPGERYSGSRRSSPLPDKTQLPEAYGTRQLFLVARDPHWLYAHWDFTREQLKQCNALSASGHLTLRIYRETLEGAPLPHIELHPESRSWFAPVP